jgi:phosphate starvation-inducible protein PhoH
MSERKGFLDFAEVLKRMEEFDLVQFGIEDVIRSGIVRSFLIAEHEYEQETATT